jgi:hypothetical protein
MLVESRFFQSCDCSSQFVYITSQFVNLSLLLFLFRNNTLGACGAYESPENNQYGQ